MLASTKYTLNNSTIIVHSNVNEFIDFNLINEYFDKIIFSDYNDVKICIETNNTYDEKYHNHWKSRFNRLVILTNNLTHLTFSFKFNQLIILTNNLTHLTFGCFESKTFGPPHKNFCYQKFYRR